MKKSIAIIGGGASALMLAAHLDTQKFDVTIYERNVAPGRKFLVAGDGGFNLTHSEMPDLLANRYTPASFLSKAIGCFNNSDLRKWLCEIGIDTYIGTSKRVFPVKGIKPITVLNSFLNVLSKNQITIKNHHQWEGWTDEMELRFAHLQNKITVKPDITVFALGGGSWKITGSDGKWLPYFKEKNILTSSFQPSNCAYKINWPVAFLDFAEGKSLKNITLTCGALQKKGEVVITHLGLEGGGIYALSPAIRKELTETGSALVFADLKPDLSIDVILHALKYRGNKSLSQQLQTELNINTLQLSLLKNVLSKEEFTDPEQLASNIKRLTLRVTGYGPIDEAISTVGGIDLSEVDSHYELHQLPGHFVIGEMLNWDAPTGGYLLQACFSMGFLLAKHLNSAPV